MTGYSIPHGIAVTLGVATATYISEKLGLAPAGHFTELNTLLQPWYAPYDQKIRTLSTDNILSAMKLDKKNTSTVMNCIMTRGPGRMEKRSMDPAKEITPLLREFQKQLS